MTEVTMGTENELTKDELEALSIVYEDEDLLELDHTEWTEVARQGDLVHESGAKVQMTGATGRWVGIDERGRLLRGKGRGIRYFKRPSTAIAALELE